MKYIIVLGDGMADEPIPSIQGKTPLMVADTPCIDLLAKKSELGIVHTIPEGMKPGSDTANLSVLGYNPEKYYSGRSPLEALSIGVDMKDTDIALRCNLVTLSLEEDFEEKTIIDHSAGEISTEEAKLLIEALKKELEDDIYKFYLGTSYRHLTIWEHGKVIDLAQPHDILGKIIGDYLPKEPALKNMMKRSYDILNNHPVNIERKKKGQNVANSIWFWGAGTRPALTSFEEKYGKRGAMISAVDLLKGIAVGTKMKVVEVEGANGTLHTNYEGKARAALDVLLKENYDFVYIHVEAPDEMGHQGNTQNKIKAIEYLDYKVIKTVTVGMEEAGVDYRMLIMPDHPTPIKIRTHTDDPVPYLLYDSRVTKNNPYSYNEFDAKNSGNLILKGYTIIDRLFKNPE
ncbi:cofactor-independent phosphoglycerate mutase [Herbinix luporum]|jgi:2,3-bisphosphoglycerate-independent phosphoglycerate mutase|uniref:Putative 2,3-bisphosphoglycerate-independent phosphoglycerate mutase n=1 Tax=Herbinix luporum TaxID=1679721 RepID=A0A0K8J7V1_9FIRM|nr:cofactor-independent phosphoglycerate mutase [Herbinix luporum]MDI9488431.1 cofactor-independent phosphoglycerate mutase [Bacillota bacterium]CUH93696.1 putative 2,3-bisphosphoglycerate-independent phosphoglycerate mutase [Herbinix luporum]HHT56595.1 cofactor-independent phosphoglycerate mutase [Herbinix luporum]